jgi:hypothetical protein
MGKSDFGRQKTVEAGLVLSFGSSVSLSASDGRVWISSSMKSFSRPGGGNSILGGIPESGFMKRRDVVTFERGSALDGIPEAIFQLARVKSITIPVSVTVLGKRSFCGCDSLEFVMFESGSRLGRIEGSAFYGSGLPSIVIPSSVVVLGEQSFSQCKSLESVRFENGSRLERIERSAFSWSGLQSVVIPPSVTFIDGSAFDDVSLKAVSISPDNKRFRLRGCFLESFDGSTIYRYYVFRSPIVIFESSSGRRPFRSPVFRTGFPLEFAFHGSGLNSIVIPSSVAVLGKSSFSECKSVRSVIFENGSQLERFEESAFYGSGLQSIVIPSSVVVLDKSSFSECKSLLSVIFESGCRLERIGESSFYGTALQSIVIPSSVVFLGKTSFTWFKDLRSVIF